MFEYLEFLAHLYEIFTIWYCIVDKNVYNYHRILHDSITWQLERLKKYMNGKSLCNISTRDRGN